MSKRCKFLVLTCALVMSSGVAVAAPIEWVSMESLTLSNLNSNTSGSMTGVISTSDGSVGVDYQGVVLANSVLNSVGYWGYGSDPAYMVDGVSYAPPTPYGSQMLMVNGGYDFINTIHFSTTVENPVIAIKSLGSALSPLEFVFGATFEILSQDPASGLSIPTDSILHGSDGSGLIRFVGLFDSLSWVINGMESGWTGVSVGIERIADTSQLPSDPVFDVPEPSAWMLMSLGLLMVGVSIYRNQQA